MGLPARWSVQPESGGQGEAWLPPHPDVVTATSSGRKRFSFKLSALAEELELGKEIFSTELSATAVACHRSSAPIAVPQMPAAHGHECLRQQAGPRRPSALPYGALHRRALLFPKTSAF